MYQIIAQAIVAALISNQVAVAPTHAASCLTDHQPASIAKAAPVEYPAIAKLEGLTGTAVIQVDLADDGSLRAAYVAHSSGSPILDQAAIRTVSKMVYAPETRGCKAVYGSYAVEVEFAD